jgi:hypothetical protein
MALAKIANYLFWLKPYLFICYPLAEANGNDICTWAFDVKHSVFDIKTFYLYPFAFYLILFNIQILKNLLPLSFYKHVKHRTNNPSPNLAPAQGYIVPGPVPARYGNGGG